MRFSRLPADGPAFCILFPEFTTEPKVKDRQGTFAEFTAEWTYPVWTIQFIENVGMTFFLSCKGLLGLSVGNPWQEQDKKHG